MTDLGTENGIMADIHAFFRNDPDRHRCVTSPRNQRIKSWWALFRRTNTSILIFFAIFGAFRIEGVSKMPLPLRNFVKNAHTKMLILLIQNVKCTLEYS